MLEPEAVAEPAEGQKEAAIRVFLIRHGESESNAGLASATPDSAALTARGRWQAEQVARVIADDPALIKPQVEAYWVQADPGDRRGNGAESFTDLLGRSSDCLSRLSAQASGPVVVFTHGLFMRAVAWSLLTGVTMPGTRKCAPSAASVTATSSRTPA